MKMAYVLGAAIIGAAGIGLFVTTPKDQPKQQQVRVAAENADLPPGHPPTGGAVDESEELPPGHPAVGDEQQDMPPGHPQVGSATDLPPGHPEAAAAPAPAQGDAAGDVSGEVLETIQVSSYTYLRLKTPKGEVWAAVGKTDLSKGQHVDIQRATLMHDFSSPTLKRSFKEIYFGMLAPTKPRGDKPSKGANTPL
ncbi:MAG: hypothetical protein AB7K71_34040 [Polyangiaceae bacterium]